MSGLAGEMARLLWWYLLWVMRRPWMKRLQRRWLGWVRVGRRAAAKEAVLRQNKWARRNGLRVLTITMNVLLASLAVTLTYLIALNLNDAGLFQGPQRQ